MNVIWHFSSSLIILNLSQFLKNKIHNFVGLPGCCEVVLKKLVLNSGCNNVFCGLAILDVAKNVANAVPVSNVVALSRAVKTGYPARVGPAHDGLRLLRAGPKRPGR